MPCAALDGLGELKEETLLTALGDEQPAIRRHAIRLSEPLLEKSSKVSAAVLKHAEEMEPTIRLQLAYSLGEWNDPRAAQSLSKIALASQSDPYITAGVMSSLNKENVGTVLATVMGGKRETAAAGTAGRTAPRGGDGTGGQRCHGQGSFHHHAIEGRQIRRVAIHRARRHARRDGPPQAVFGPKAGRQTARPGLTNLPSRSRGGSRAE